jgi:hypothetical protein
VGPGRRDDERPLLARPLPRDGSPWTETLGEIRREIHGDLSVEAVGPADEADEKNRGLSV